MNEITEEKALEILHNATDQIKLTRSEHQIILLSLEKLRIAVEKLKAQQDNKSQ